jgi:hypothetical protein
LTKENDLLVILAAVAAQKEKTCSVDSPFQMDARCCQEDTLMSSVNATVAKRPSRRSYPGRCDTR